MTLSTFKQENDIEPIGFTVSTFPSNQRLQVVTLSSETMAAFEQTSIHFPLQSVEYKPFLRFAIAEALDKICHYTLGKVLSATLNNRNTSAFLLQYEQNSLVNTETEEALGNLHVLLSTAISHLIGIPNFDSMYGKYYARFTVRNVDNSDSYLRQAHRRMELHNDGTYVNEHTDFVLMMKMAEENMEGGDSLLLHMDDWQDLDKFYHHPMAKQNIQWGAPPSKNIDYKMHHPVFFEEDSNGKPHMLFIDQFAEPQNRAEGLYLYAMSESLESENNCFNVSLPVGSMLVVQNHVWMHGRDKFVAHEGLRRELLRQRGHFTK
ncbi:protein CsiD [Candidatus Endobugula sertula]|uniref:Protein CsiD n=1 Tax=Candidatus Endobugula sertula TaxID=62101 RepID=A0A1D2QP12_9GAMM|nr:protein CsiD [Candidatus Endobugula sertula]